jgi:hypothetical protein
MLPVQALPLLHPHPQVLRVESFGDDEPLLLARASLGLLEVAYSMP